MTKVVQISVLLFVAFSMTSTLVRSQSSTDRATGRLMGMVVDTSDARVAGATVIIEAKGLRRTIFTGEDGTYMLDLPPGIYRMRVSSRGFCAAGRPDFRVHPSANIKFNFMLIVCPIVNSLKIVNGEYQGEMDNYQEPFRQEELPIGLPGTYSLLIQYGERVEDRHSIYYKGFKTAEDKCLGVTVNYDLITIHADKVRFDKKSLRLEAQGNVTFEDHMKRIQPLRAEVGFKGGEPAIKLTMHK